MGYKSGFASIIGRPNVGKSTLLNKIIGEKIAIMSSKPQTTRNKIQAIYTGKDFQIVFIDTPGIHKPKHKLGQFMVNAAKESLKEVDVILYVVEDGDKIGPGDQYIIEEIKDIDTPIILVMNKIDKMNQEQFNKLYEMYKETDIFTDIIAISALEDVNIGVLIQKIVDLLRQGPQYYPEDMITDQPERVIVSEIIREKILHYTEEEIPHGVAVEITMMKKRPDKDIVDINATIYCEKQSHKGIIIGKGGRKLKGIGKSAREDIERLLGSKVYLELWVKVSEDWRNNQHRLRNFGYE